MNREWRPFDNLTVILLGWPKNPARLHLLRKVLLEFLDGYEKRFPMFLEIWILITRTFK